MNKEIKELLKDFKTFSDSDCIYEISSQDCKLLSDYITNLQEENEKLKEIVENLTTITVCGDRKQIKNTAQYKLEKTQQRINKALKDIDEYKKIFNLDLFSTALENIEIKLKGEDNE